MIISEIFGPTVQGEGPSAGRRCAFIRLGLCNLDCTWCDTAYTWDWSGKNGIVYDRKSELSDIKIENIMATIESMGVDMVVISGGEPLVQRMALRKLLVALRDYEVEIETNGTLSPGGLLSLAVWNVSPKLDHAKVSKPSIVGVVLEEFVQGAASFKFVVQKLEDLDEVASICDLHGIPLHRTWIMPEGRTVQELNRSEVLDEAIVRGYNVTGRLQVLLWGAKRGH